MSHLNRRKFLKSLAQSSLAAPFINPKLTSSKSNSRPNIILFVADDQRNDTLGSAGHPILKTPNIDTLSANGCHFDNAFVTTSICAASRASIFTGLYERTHQYTFNKPPIKDVDIESSYPVLLRNSGYKTAFIGKFGVEVSATALGSMFDFRVSFPLHRYFFKMEDGSLRHETDYAADLAIEYIRQEQNNPFVISVNFNSPHADPTDFENHFPWPESADGLYEDLTLPEPLLSFEDVFNTLPEFLQTSLNRERFFWRWDTDEKYQKNMKAYFRMISGIDTSIGRVMSELQALSLADNTIIIYVADNGYYMGNRGFAGKWSHYEESLRIPLIIFDPRVKNQFKGKHERSIALNVDIAATILDLAEIEIPYKYQGLSLMPLVNSFEGILRSDFFCEHLMEHAGIPKWEGVRTKDFIYARYFEQNPVYEFLHEFNTDPNELINLATNINYQEQLEILRLRCDELVEMYTPATDPIFKNGFDSQV